MNKVIMSLIVAAFILTGTSFAQTPPAAPAPAAKATEKEKASHHEHHSELHKALRKLKAVKQDLEKASHEYGGHKAKAIEAIDQAIEEIKTALESEKK